MRGTKMSVRISIAVFAASTLISGLLLAPSTSKALERRNYGFGCRAYAVNGGDDYDSKVSVQGGSTQNVNGGISNASTQTAIDLFCPYDDDDRFRADQVSTLNVHVYDGNNSSATAYDVYAQACIQYYGSNTGTCDTSTNTTT